jgi:hypothetical protein
MIVHSGAAVDRSHGTRRNDHDTGEWIGSVWGSRCTEAEEFNQ